MNGKTFLDTNIVVYANDSADSAKREKALESVQGHIRAQTGVVSTLVLMEYCSVAVTKLLQPIEAVEHQIEMLTFLEVVSVSPNIIAAGLRLRQAYSLSFWDAVVVASAQASNCRVLLSEDMNHNRMYGTVLVLNPFISE
ncbi:MAG: PIN domain-containing protein [Spirochaetales bacterium]|nr:PIN domain-containing protein [Spirochaetales bacterium]